MADKPKSRGKVTFLEEPHVYLNENNQRYLSVTQLIDKFKSKFNALEAAQAAVVGKNPKYVGRTVKSVMDEWANNGQFAREEGTKFHKSKETGNTTKTIEEEKKKREVPIWIKKKRDASAIIPTGDDVETDYHWLPDGVYDELIVWSHHYHLAGIADKIIVDGDFFDIEDYKTNAEIHRTSFFKKGQGYKMLEWPLDHIMDCSYYHYELQLSLYAYMFSLLSGKKLRNLTILHHPKQEIKQPDGTKKIVVRAEEERIPLKYRLTDVKTMLSLWGGYAPQQWMPNKEETQDEPITELP